MLQASPQEIQAGSQLRRLAEFTETRPDDTYLDVTDAPGPGMAALLGPHVDTVTTATTSTLPEGTFTLVTARLALAGAPDRAARVATLLDHCQDRLVLAEPVRPQRAAADRDHIERLHDPAHTHTSTLQELIDLVTEADGAITRLDVLTIERPIAPWLADAHDPDAIRQALITELDGGPPTGTRPRLIGRELWFTQSWAHLAVACDAPLSSRRYV